jgi:hypothetical protein
MEMGAELVTQVVPPFEVLAKNPLAAIRHSVADGHDMDAAEPNIG